MAEQNIINSIEFAKKNLEIHGTLPLLQFSRCFDLLASSKGEVQWSLQGSSNTGSKPKLLVNVQAVLDLTCQRCLGPYPFRLDTASSFTIVMTEAELPAEADDMDEQDYLVADPQLSVLELIEDEILLALPFAPKHPPEKCAVTVAEADESRLQKPNPFAVLQGLKTGK